MSQSDEIDHTTAGVITAALINRGIDLGDGSREGTFKAAGQLYWEVLAALRSEKPTKPPRKISDKALEGINSKLP